MRIIMTKKALPIILLIACMMLYSCAGSPGDVYLKYTWASAPQSFYDENPSTPLTVYNDVYFFTFPGTYYMDYIAWDGSGYWMIYTLTANPGEAFFTNGEDALFEIYLSSSGPGFYKLQSVSGGANVNTIENSYHTDQNHPKSASSSDGQLVPIYIKEVTRGGYTLKIEYGIK